MKIDNSDWSLAIVDIGSRLVEDRTLQSEKSFREFCGKYGYKLVRFVKGTNEMCE